MTSLKRYHEGPCGPCALCSAKATKYTHPESMTEVEIALIHKFQGRDISQACICLPCAKQVKRNVNKPNFHPRWLPKEPKREKLCSIEKCAKTVYRNTNLATPEEINELLQERVVAFTAEPTGASVGLCQDHYLRLYSKLYQFAPCESCNARPKKGEQFYRHCPSPNEVNAYLNLITSEHCALTSDSCICLTCYKFFNSVVKQIRGVNIENTTDINMVIVLIDKRIEATQPQLTWNDHIELMMCKTAKKLAELMKSDGAILLPVLYSKFCHEVQNRASLLPPLSSLPNQKIPGIRWLLSRLHSLFGDSLQVICKQSRYGSVLFHKDCDLVKALSTALGKSETLQKQVTLLKEQQNEIQTSKSTEHQTSIQN